MTASANTEKPALSRGLKNRHLQLIAIGGAVGTGLFLGSGRTISLAGPSIIFVYAIIGFVLFFLMRALGELLLSDLKYKTFGDIAADVIGPWAGFFVSWTYWFAWVVAAIADIIAITVYARYLNQGIPPWTIAVAVAILLLLLNLISVKAFGEAEFWLSLVKVAAIIALIIVGTIMIATGFNGTGSPAALSNLWEEGGMFPLGAAGFVLGFQMGIYAFIGIELIGTAAGETAEPHVTLPKAVNSTVVRVLVFYVGSLVVIMSVTPWTEINPNLSPFTSMFSMAGLSGAALVVNLVCLCAAFSAANSGIYSGSRMLYGLSVQGHAGKRFKKLNKRHVPINAVVLVILLLGFSFPLLYASDNLITAFTFVTSVGSSLVLFTWGMITVSYIRYRRRYPDRHQRAQFRLPFAAVTPWVILAFFGFITYALCQADETRTAHLPPTVEGERQDVSAHR